MTNPPILQYDVFKIKDRALTPTLPQKSGEGKQPKQGFAGVNPRKSLFLTLIPRWYGDKICPKTGYRPDPKLTRSK
jgi:hypothetical protein